MNDYRYTQLEELNTKIAETEALIEDPSLAELAKEELVLLQEQKSAIEKSLEESQEKNSADDLDSRNVILEIKGAAGGDEAKKLGR